MSGTEGMTCAEEGYCICGNDCMKPSDEDQKQLELEMLYTTYSMSCLNPALVAAPDSALETRECRRPKGHPGYHASGFGKRLVHW